MAHIFEDHERTSDVINKDNTTFENMFLPENLMKGLRTQGFRKPSPIQLKAIPIGRCGFDLIVKSKSGTGKTLIFAALALDMVDVTRNAIQGLILAPTREVAVQIQDVIRSIGEFYEGLKVESFIGGLPLEEDMAKLKTCHIAIGAPGRVKHLIEAGTLKTNGVKLFVLDEADKLMATSFYKDINDIFNALPERKQMLALSATYPVELETFLANYMLTPTFINLSSDQSVLLGIQQFVVPVRTAPNMVQQQKVKTEALLEILSKVCFNQCLVYTNYQTRAETISNILNQNDWNSKFITGAQNQVRRLEAINALKTLRCRILLSTDLTARGIDATNVNLVINYDVPNDAATYLHRMGRAGRFGQRGLCLTLTGDENESLELQKILGKIGGTEMFVVEVKLHKDFPQDIWNLDMTALRKVFGIITLENEEKCIDIKQSVFKIKAKKNGKKTKNKAKKMKTEERPETLVDPREVLGPVPGGVGKKEDENDNTDVRQLLQSISTQVEQESMQNETPSKQHGEEQGELLRTIPQESLNSSIDSGKEDSVLKTAIKNVGQLNFIALLNRGEAAPDCGQSLQNFLDTLKWDDTNRVSEIVKKFKDHKPKEILENIENFITGIENDVGFEVPLNDEESLQRIFELCFNHALNPGAKHWLSYFTPETREEFADYCEKEKQKLEEESEDEECDDFDFIGDEDTIEDDFEDMPSLITEQSSETSTTFLGNISNVPQLDGKSHKIGKDFVLPPEFIQTSAPLPPPQLTQSLFNSDQDKEYYKYFTPCFESVSDNLWNNALLFENVQSFDQWFEKWEEQLHLIRTYTQQNIYVGEMSKYQRMKWFSDHWAKI